MPAAACGMFVIKLLTDVACADAFTPHSSRLSSELRPLASVPLLQHAPAPAVSVAAHVDRLTSASMRWLQVQPSSAPCLLLRSPNKQHCPWLTCSQQPSPLVLPQLQNAQQGGSWPWPWPGYAGRTCFCLECYV